MSLSSDLGHLTADLRRVSRLRHQAIADLRHAVDATLDELAAGRKKAARERRTQARRNFVALRDSVKSLRKATARDIERQMKSRRANGAKLHASLDHSVAAVANQTDELCQAAVAFVTSLSEARRDLAKRQRASLSSGVRTLRTEVRALRNRIQRQRVPVRADLAKAHAIWISFVSGMSAKGRGAAGATPSRAEKHAEVKGESEAAAPKPPIAAKAPMDDLTRIDGIGPGMQERLEKMGIKSFAQLAAADAETVKRQLGDIGRFANVATWIARAREIVGTK